MGHYALSCTIRSSSYHICCSVADASERNSTIFFTKTIHYALVEYHLFCAQLVKHFLYARALYTFILYKICILHKRPSHLVYLLSLVCFFVLLDNPMQLFFLDFQLSFTLTFALAWFNQISSRKNN